MRGAAFRSAAAAAGLALVDSTTLFAAEHAAAEGHAEGAHAPSIGELLFPAINFAIFAVILVKYVVPAMREYLRRRAHDVTSAITETSAALSEAEALMTATRARASSVATERESIRRDLLAAATRHTERLRAQAEETGKRRLADAALVAEQERRRALQEVRAEIAALATDLAESRLRTAVSAEDQRAFVERFLKEAPTR